MSEEEASNPGLGMPRKAAQKNFPFREHFSCSHAGNCTRIIMRVIAKRTLREHWQKPGRRDSEQSLKAWHAEAEAADWSLPTDVKKQFATASILKAGRVVFNIAGNKYRLVVKISYEFKVVYIRFIGTHREYDRIDAERI